MLLNQIQLNGLNFNPINRNKVNRISFGSKPDVFQKNITIQNCEFSPNLSEAVQKQLKEKVLFLVNNETQPLGYGMNGAVHQLKNVFGFGYDGVAIKISHIEDKNPKTGDSQRTNCDFSDEIENLRKIEPLKEQAQQYLGRIKLSDNRNVLITTFISGQHPDSNKEPMSLEHLSSLLEVLSKLDNIGVLHRDLKQENLIITSYPPTTKLIDFGEAKEFDILDFKQQDDNNFPSFVAPTNLRNLEDTFISPYLDELQKKYPSEASGFYKFYLEQKAHIVFEKRAGELTSYLSLNEENLSSEQILRLQEMIDYQTVMGEVLSQEINNDDILNIELMKNQVLYMSELAYKNEVLLANPLANVTLKTNALICAKKLEKMILAQINRPNKPNVQKYLNYQLREAQYRQKKIAGWLNGLVGWITTCLTTDIDTQDKNKKKIIDECLKPDLENFEIPNVAANPFKGVLDESI